MSGPQPLLKVNPKADYISAYTPTVAHLNPELYHLAHRVILLAAWGETMWGHMFGNLLHGAPLPSFAIYQRLESAAAKNAILLAAAESELPAEDFRRLQALQKAVAPIFKVRNQFAHHHWGHSPQIPNALLLSDPARELEWIKWGLQGTNLKDRNPDYSDATTAMQDTETDKTGVVVWSREALETRAVTSIGIMSELCLPGMHDRALEQARNDLFQWPRFAAALQRIEAKIPR